MNYVSGFEISLKSLSAGFLVVLGLGMRLWIDTKSHPPLYILAKLQDFSGLN